MPRGAPAPPVRRTVLLAPDHESGFCPPITGFSPIVAFRSFAETAC